MLWQSSGGRMIDFGSDLHLAKLLPEFAQLQAILGWRIKETIQWAPYSRLVQIHGWKRLLKAVERCEPGKRWASDAERECQQLAKDEADSLRAYESRQRMERVEVGDRKERGEMFREIRQRVMGDTK